LDARIHRIVMASPIPEKLIHNLGRAPFLPLYACRRYANMNLTPNLLETLPLVCHGFSNKEIAAQRHYSEEATKDHVKRLLAIFRARNRAHLAALAVAQGYVEMSEERLPAQQVNEVVYAGLPAA
jgi:DNA-binding NarL/FixJ family response regulator